MKGCMCDKLPEVTFQVEFLIVYKEQKLPKTGKSASLESFVARTGSAVRRNPFL